LKSALTIYRKLIWIFALAFLLRVGLRLHSGSADFWVNGYTFFFDLAKNLAAGNGYAFPGMPATSFRVPLYPLFLAALTFGHQLFLPVVLAQSLVGVGTVWCAAILARDIFGNTAAIIAAFLTAIYPYYVVHDTALQETSLYTFLMALAVVLLVRVRRTGSIWSATGSGLALGSAVLTRASLAPFALFAPLWLAFFGGLNAAQWRPKIWAATFCMGVAALTVSPWLFRAYLLTGSATLSTEAGFQLWVGNNPYTFSHYPVESIDRSQATALAALTPQDQMELHAAGNNEAAKNQWFLKAGLDYIRENPWQTLVSGFRKVLAAFCIVPSPRRSFWPTLIYSISYTPVLILGLTGMWMHRSCWREETIFYAQFLTFAAVTALFVGHTSYRAYLDVYWIVFAAGFLEVLLVAGRTVGKQLTEPS
jgi:4-amino-4-deoxy-L-arabinose transferase-like glycosyltransferase